MGNQEPDSVAFWQDKLFTTAMTFSIALSLIAAVPGVLFSILKEYYVLALLDVLAVVFLVLAGFGRFSTIRVRKIFFIGVLYFCAAYLLLYLGITGPGLLYLLAASVFALLILPVQYAWWWSWMNFVVVLLFALVLYFHISPVAMVNATPVDQWLVVASNLLFLSFTFSYLIPRLVGGLSASFTTQRELQQSLRERNTDLDHYASIISHDLQSPMRTISGFIAQLERKYGTQLDEKGKEYIRMAGEGAANLQQVVQALLDFSRSANHDSGSFTRFSLLTITSQLEAYFLNLPENQDARIIVTADCELVSNKQAVQEVLHNLISNGLKYRREGVPPVVKVSAAVVDGYWEIQVEDNGIGIEKEYFDRIFIIFQRLHNRIEYEGTGVGLAIVKRIVEKLNGRIWLKSLPGNGTIFYFTIPKHNAIS